MATVNKTELARRIAVEAGINIASATRAIETLAENIMAETEAGNTVNIAGFGRFTQKVRAARQGRNPATGAAIDIPERRQLAFKAAKAAE